MKYRLTIEQFAPNANYSEELKKWNEDRRRYGGFPNGFGDGAPQPETVVKVLTVEVTDIEFAAIKKAAVETMA